MPALITENNGKAPDFGATLARRRSQDFKSKIEGWNDHASASPQTQNEVLVTTDSPKDQPESKPTNKSSNTDEADGVTNAQSTPVVTTLLSRLPSREVDLKKRAWVRRKSKPPAEVAEEIKQATSPKKRVISDGHWRKDRLAKPTVESSTTSEEQLTPALSLLKQAKSDNSPKVSVTVQQWVETTPGHYKLGTPRQSTSKDMPKSQDRDSPDYESDGVKIYVSRRRAGQGNNNDDRRDGSTSETGMTSNSSTGKPSSATDRTSPNRTPSKEQHSRSAPRHTPTKKSQTDDIDTVRSSERRRRIKPADGTSVDKPDRPISTSPPVFRNRIEGWLADTGNTAASDTAQIKPVGSPNKAVRSTPMSKDDDAITISTTSTPTLQRRGARKASHSPVKQGTDDRFQPRDFSSSSRTTTEKFTFDRVRPASSGATETTAPTHDERSIVSRLSDGDQPNRRSSRKRKVANHSDLISVLSVEDRGIRSARSVRARQVRPSGDVAAEVMNQITVDELRYLRELRTLIDGVIPVLLTHVLQRNDPSGSKRLFSGSSKTGQALTQPIVEMGVALERLKSLQRRIPLHGATDFITWASGAAKAYADYIKAWRLGFNDLVVKLAARDEVELPKSPGSWESSLRLANTDKDATESANVAYLLKRPLVRLKHFAQSLETLNQVLPSATTKDTLAVYNQLLKDARQKVSDERARLEDETAASIDPSRARDPHSLVAVAGVRVDRTRSVRARDFFDLDLVHSTGQQLGCKIEIIARDNAASRGTLGDILFCEVSLAGRWLLFPPISAKNISARQGEKDGELVIMLRGLLPTRQEWREVMSLVTEDPIVVQEWVEILGSSPIPSRLAKKSSFNAGSRDLLPDRTMKKSALSAYAESVSTMTVDADVPLGEPAKLDSSSWTGSEDDDSTIISDETRSPLRRSRAARQQRTQSTDSYDQVHDQVHSRRYDEHSRDRHSDLSSDLTYSSYDTFTQKSRSDASSASTEKQGYTEWSPSSNGLSSQSRSQRNNDTLDATDMQSNRTTPQQPSMHRRTSSVPSTDLPNTPKPRRGDPVGLDTARSPRSRTQDDRAVSKVSSESPRPEQMGGASRPATHVTQRARASTGPHALQMSNLPPLTPTFLKKQRRTSSPLKHEYEPSTASESFSETDIETDDDDIISVTSESSTESHAEDVSIVGDLRGFQKFVARPVYPTTSPKAKLTSIDETSLGPSDSASQGPYRSTPPGAGRAESTLAGLFSWSDSGTWTSLHPEECSIFVGPGLIEAFDVTQAREAMASQIEGVQSPSQCGVKPLVALELTPLVPLRRGTAVDISVRSPPTSGSLLRAGSNIMFRSRTPEDCEKLYALVNRARIDNPTFIALQNARGPVKTSNWAEAMDRQNAARSSAGSSWWPASLSRKGSTYRSRGSRATSTAATESSVGTLNSAFSALRRFSGGGKMFDIARSTLMSREGTRSSTNSDSLSSSIATPTLSFDPRLGTPMGVTNTKIRLYVRESASKWRDLGAARLTILIPPRDEPAIVNNSRATGLEKRVLVRGASKSEILLDALLPETSFERVARTGIAVSVWRESTDLGASGGVGSATLRVYMLQLKSERDAAFTFGLVGKLRY